MWCLATSSWFHFTDCFPCCCVSLRDFLQTLFDCQKMIATISNVQPMLAGSMRSSLATLLPAIASRPALSHARCFAASAKPAAGEQQQHDDTQQQQLEANSSPNVGEEPASVAMVHPAFGIHRIPSIFAEMQREMDALSRSFGMPRVWADTDMFMQPFQSPIWNDFNRLSTRGLPSMRLATDVEEDDNSYTIKADVPGM